MEHRQALGVADPSDWVTVDGVTLAIRREGQGPTVVCLHAIAHGSRDYDALVQNLRSDFECIRIDWPGHGRSGDDHQPPSVSRYATLLEGVLDQLGVTHPIVIGNSMGGGAAIHFAARRPARALVLCDSAGLIPIGRMTRGFVRLFAAIFRAGERGARWFDVFYRFHYQHIVLPASSAAQQRTRIIAAGRDQAPTLRRAWESFGRPEADLRQTLWSLELPIWFAWAKRDRVIPLRLCRKAIDRVQQGQLDVFPGGHSPFLEAPEAFASGFRRFVDGLNARDGAGQSETS